jgi:hypothetical protein
MVTWTAKVSAPLLPEDKRDALTANLVKRINDSTRLTELEEVYRQNVAQIRSNAETIAVLLGQERELETRLAAVEAERDWLVKFASYCITLTPAEARELAKLLGE